MTPEPAVAPEIAAAIRVLYEDEELLAVEKPAGIPVHPAGQWVDRTLVRLLRARRGLGIGAPVHRLDRDTSGVVLFARTERARRALGLAVQARRVRKLYLAVTTSPPRAGTSGTVRWPIALDAESGIAVRRRVAADGDEGEAAETRWRVVARSGSGSGRTLVAAVPVTGRTHQIRVHLAALGAAIAGDKLYGVDPGLYLALRDRAPTAAEHAALCGLKRHALHAAALGAVHPATGRWIRFVSPLPDELAALLR